MRKYLVRAQLVDFEALDHDVGGLDEGGYGVALFELKFAGLRWR